MNNTRLKLRAGTALSAMLVTGSLFAAPAFAQDAAPQSGNQEPAGGQEIVVTGSRIANPNLTSVSPVTVVSGLEVKQQGNIRVEDLLNSLPQVFASEGSTDANGASGIATVDLRNLGTRRTLVLINGRRLGSGDPTDPVADINFIPGALIKRIDVLTGGASAAYGSDALAGVVNFILDKDFKGFQLDAQTSFYNHNNNYNNANYASALAARNYVPPKGNTVDGEAQLVNLTLGAGFDDDRGHITAYAGWRKVNAVTQGDRDYSYCGYSASSVSCGGSSTSAVGRFRATQNVGLGQNPVYSPTGPSYTTNPNAPGTFRSYVSARDGFNFNPYNYFMRPDERYTLGAFAHYDVSDAFKPYLETMFMDDHTRAQIAPSGAFYGTDFFVNCNNALMSTAQQQSLCGANAGTNTLQSLYIGRRNVEGAGRVDDLRHTDYRIVAGAQGDIAKGIHYDVYGQFWRAMLSERYENDFSRAKINRALNVVKNSAGQNVCAAALPNAQGQVIDANCVPWNIWNPGGVTQAAVNYLQTPGFQSGTTDQYIASGTVSADLGQYGLKSPFTDNGVQAAVGFEYRKEQLELTHDIEFLTGDLAGQGTPFGVPDVRGKYSVKEFFGELSVPLVSGKPGFETLGFNGAYRHSQYSLTGGTDAYKAELEYAPIKQVRFRAGYNRAVRSPNTLELFNTPNVTLFSGKDPCAGATPTASLAQCQRSGVAAADYGKIDINPAGQQNQRTAGNRNLKPETADTLTAGVVLNPFRGLSVSVDYFNIKIKDLIGTVGAVTILGNCINSGLNCNQINRAPGGSLFTGTGFVDNPTLNLGSLKTSGIDLNALYNTHVGTSTLAFDVVGTYLHNYVDGNGRVCDGQFGANCGTPLPKWRSKSRVTYTMANGLGASLAWRYFAATKNDTAGVDPAVARIAPVSYIDLSLSAQISKKYTFRIGAQNLFDKTPPVLDSNYTNNGSGTYAQVYDSLGRYVYAAIQLSF